MPNIKFVSVFAGFGFILSFVFGLFSHSSFLMILLKALVFAIIFALVSGFISGAFNKFLDEPSMADSEDSTNDEVSNPTSNLKGQVVDITIQDEDLPEGESGNSFEVGDNHQMLNDSDIKRIESRIEQTASNQEAANNNFVPLRKVETAENVSSVEAQKPDESPALESIQTEASDGENLDTLPDMDTIGFSPETNGASAEASTNDDESDENFVSNLKINSKDAGGDVADAGLMAKAISSLLANENS